MSLADSDAAYPPPTFLDPLAPEGIQGCLAPYSLLPPMNGSFFDRLGIPTSTTFPLDVCVPGSASCDMLRVPKPVIAAINGACAGIGMVQALMTDIRFAAKGAKFTTAFVRRGLIEIEGIVQHTPAPRFSRTPGDVPAPPPSFATPIGDVWTD